VEWNLKVEALDHLVVNVSDVERSADWYERVLGMTRLVSDHEGHVRTAMLFGKQKVNLRPMSATKEEWFTADQDAAGSDDLCFLTRSTPEQVVAHLSAYGVGIVSGPGPRSGARGTIISVYCRDPDGSLIEISSYQGD
jgi:catechol 2,3-dioxygenase-like lactoylglutathione lyase family enzyme